MHPPPPLPHPPKGTFHFGPKMYLRVTRTQSLKILVDENNCGTVVGGMVVSGTVVGEMVVRGTVVWGLVITGLVVSETIIS